MRKLISFGFLLILCAGLLYCASLLYFSLPSSATERDMYQYICRKTSISLPKNVSIEYTDSHGGFHGDGNLFAIVTPTTEQAKTQMNGILSNPNWSSSLPGDMYTAFFGGMNTVDGIEYCTDGYLHNFELDIPYIKDGYFYYKDRFFEQWGEQCSIAPYTQNFTLAIFDFDSSTLYCIEGDL